MTEKILQFPKDKIVRENMNNEYIEKMKTIGTKNFADALCDDIEQNILIELSNYGIDVEKDTFVKDFYYASSIYRATVYRALNIPHDLQKFIDEHVNISIMPEETEMQE